MPTLTTRQAAFVEAYRGNAVEAVRAAGYAGSEETLQARAVKLMKHPAIIAALAERRAADGVVITGDGIPTSASHSSSTTGTPASASSTTTVDPEAILEAIARDQTQRASARTTAAKELHKIRQQKLAQDQTAQSLEALQSRLFDILRKREAINRECDELVDGTSTAPTAGPRAAPSAPRSTTAKATAAKPAKTRTTATRGASHRHGGTSRQTEDPLEAARARARARAKEATGR